MALIDLYTRQLTMVHNKLHALDQLPVRCKEALSSLQKTKEHLQKEVAKLEAHLQTQLEQWQGAQLKNIGSIPGLGKRAVALLIVYTDGFTKVKNHRQLIAR
jgi:transposase